MMQTTPTHGEEAAFQPGIEIGVLASPGFHSYMGDLHSNGKAASAWMNVDISGQIHLGDNLSLVPAVDFYANGNSDSYENSYSDSTSSMNYLWVPSVNARYSFGKPSAFYLQAGPNFTFAHGGGREADFKGGVGGAAALGFVFRVGIELDVGYTYLPIDVTKLSDGTKGTANFGGPFLQLGYRF